MGRGKPSTPWNEKGDLKLRRRTAEDFLIKDAEEIEVLETQHEEENFDFEAYELEIRCSRMVRQWLGPDAGRTKRGQRIAQELYSCIQRGDKEGLERLRSKFESHNRIPTYQERVNALATMDIPVSTF